MSSRAVKIRSLPAPQCDLASFDPGAFLSGLEFYETDEPVTEAERDAFSQFAHLLAFMALKGKSSNWTDSVVARDSTAFAALQSHFEELDGWAEIDQDPSGISYRSLATFLMQHYPPHLPGK